MSEPRDPCSCCGKPIGSSGGGVVCGMRVVTHRRILNQGNVRNRLAMETMLGPGKIAEVFDTGKLIVEPEQLVVELELCDDCTNEEILPLLERCADDS